MKATGTTYKLIRETKRISQTNISNKLSITRTALSKIENNKNFTNFPTMIELLDQINMSFDEFLFIANGYSLSEKELLHSQFFSQSTQYSSIFLPNIANEPLKFFLSKKYSLMQEFYDLTYSYEEAKKQSVLIETEDFPQQTAHKIWEKIEKMDEWYIIELKIINSLLFILPAEISLALEKRLRQEIIKYEGFSEINELKLSIHANLSTLFFTEGKLDSCLEISQLLADLSKTAKRYDLYAISLIRVGICSSNMELIEKGLHILTIVEDYPLKKAMLQEIESRFF